MAKMYSKEKIHILPEEKKEEVEKPKIEKECQVSLFTFDPDNINWHKYNLAKTKEKRLFYELLAELCSIIPEPPQIIGRPRIKIKDIVFSLGLKLYSNYSGRRIKSDLDLAELSGYISTSPHYNSLFGFLSCESAYDLLKKLLEISALPLKHLEDKFSMDASGFGSYQYERWQRVRFKRGVDGKELDNLKRNYLKGHIIIGTRTNIICSAEITYGNLNDGKQAPKLLEALRGNYNVKEVSADMGYSSYNTHRIIESLGAMPFIPFQDRHNPQKSSPEIWKRMYNYFNKNKEKFFEHYHRRSNVETVFSMIKVKLGEFLKCKSYTAQRNELMVKLICHNICCLVSEIFERGVHVDFKKHIDKIVEDRKEPDNKGLVAEDDFEEDL